MHLLKIRSSPLVLPFAWSSVLGPGLFIRDHWAQVRDPLAENYKNDLSSLITLKAVKVHDSLKA